MEEVQKRPELEWLQGAHFSPSHRRRRRLRIETINKWIIILIDHVVMLFYLPSLVYAPRQVDLEYVQKCIG